MRKKKKIKIIAKKKKKIEGRRFCLCFCLGHTYTPEKKKKFSSRPQETKKTQQIYIPVFRVALLLIFFGRLGEKKRRRQRQKEKKATFLPN